MRAPTRVLVTCVVLLVGAIAVGIQAPSGVPASRPMAHSHNLVHEDGGLHMHGESDSAPVAPTEGTPFSFGSAADFGFSADAQDVMTAMGSSGLDFGLIVGDLSYGATSEENWCNFFESKVGDGKVLVIAGNHDSGESDGGNINVFVDHCNFGIDATLNGDYGKEYYFDYPRVDPLARFILTGCGLSFEVDGQGEWSCNPGDAHYNFVSDAIDGARTAAIPWVIVGMHKNCITNGVKDCGIGEAFQDLVLSKRVDLVLQGHEHNYQRSHQLSCADDDNFRSECIADSDDAHDHGAGEVINIAGTGGQGLYETGGTADEPYFTSWNSDTKGFLQVVVSAAALDVTFRNIVGDFTDSYRITAISVPDFSISVKPTSMSFFSGGSTATEVMIEPRNGFAGDVDLSTNSEPFGLSTSCSPSRIPGANGTSTCTVTGTAVGSYVLTFIGTSGELGHAIATSVTVIRVGPTARFTFSPERPEANAPVTFDASSSTDTDPTETLQARWDWDGDGTWDTGFSSSLTAEHTFAVPGAYPVALMIRDSNGLTDTASHIVLVFAPGVQVGAPPGYGLTDPAALQPRGPIYISSNAGFTVTNGVRSGAGTVANPYVIRDWLIDGSAYPNVQTMIHIEYTDAYVVIENNKIVNLAGPNHWEAIQLGHWPAIIGTQHVTIRNNHIENARHAYGISIREGSRDIRIEANYVRLDANYDWVHGIQTDRNVHDVVIEGNYVDAYTSGNFHTIGIQAGDIFVDETRRATGVMVVRNTVVNATAGGVASFSSVGTVIASNLIYSAYPGLKSVSAGLPLGIETSQNSTGAIIDGNVIHTFVLGIVIGSDDSAVLSNTIHDVEYGIFVPDSGPMQGIGLTGNSIYNTTTWNVARDAIRLPDSFEGTVVDLGEGIRPTDLTPVLFVTQAPSSQVTITWSGFLLNLSATVDGTFVFDTAATAESQDLQVSWAGSISSLRVTGMSPDRVSFHLVSDGEVVFEGSGFTPRSAYNLVRTNATGTSVVLRVQSTAAGTLLATVPAADAADYVLSAEADQGSTTGVLQSIPLLLLPSAGLVALAASYLLLRRRTRAAEPKGSRPEEPEPDDSFPL